jgi:hypothetical protein
MQDRQVWRLGARSLLTPLVAVDVDVAVRRRLGHASTETTQLYALLDDKVADAEIRAAPPARPLSSLTRLALSKLNAIACTW